MNLAERLRELRRSYGWTLREVARRVKAQSGEPMSYSYLSALERGVADSPSLRVIERIGLAYGLTVCEVLQCQE